MKFFLVRHAETTANAGSVILGGKQGGTLSIRGRKQAEALSRRLEKEKISEIYCSSSNRCKQTTAIIAKRQNCEVFYCDELQEIDMGDLAGLSHEQAELKYPNIFKDIFLQPNKRLPDGESLKDVQKRAMPLILKLAKRPGNPTILAVAHNMINRVILATLLGMPLQNGRNIKQKNACISLLDLKRDFVQIYSLDNSLHSIR